MSAILAHLHLNTSCVTKMGRFISQVLAMEVESENDSITFVSRGLKIHFHPMLGSFPIEHSLHSIMLELYADEGEEDWSNLAQRIEFFHYSADKNNTLCLTPISETDWHLVDHDGRVWLLRSPSEKSDEPSYQQELCLSSSLASPQRQNFISYS
jgi:hypothetical protein